MLTTVLSVLTDKKDRKAGSVNDSDATDAYMPAKEK
jgi:hypothetical protein